MTTDSDDTRRPARSSADVERALRSAYEATDRLPIEDDPSTARLSDPPERAGNRWRAPALVAAAAAVLVGGAVVLPGALRTGLDGEQGASGRVTATAAEAPSGPLLLTVTTIVREGPTGGPQLCLGGVAWSKPHQCGGPHLVGWDWNALPSESADGVRWGNYNVVGTYTAPPRMTHTAATEPGSSTFTLTQPPTVPSAVPPPAPIDLSKFDTPCDEPVGGWIVDRTKAGGDAFGRAYAVADELPNVGAAWVDGKGAGAASNVLNVSIVGDASDRAVAERRLRTIWGGPLCVSAATRTKAQLASILKEVQREVPSWLNGHVELDVVDLYVVVDEGDRLQRIFDQRYGAGVVRVTPALQPYEGEPVRSSAAPTSSS